MSAGRGGRAPRVYRALMGLLPGWLRERHGRAMESTFVEALERARGAGSVAVVWAWLRGAGDVLWRAVYERGRRRGDVGRSSLARTLVPDVRFAFRGFLRQPGMTLLAVVMLAVGVGASTAVFGLVDALFLRPLPFPDPDRLVYLNETAPKWNLETTQINHADHAVWRERNRTFEAMGIWGGTSQSVADEAGAERLWGLRVTYDLAPALGIRPALGRFFTPAEDAPSGEPVVMLSYDLWRERYGGDPGVLGRVIRLNRIPRTVVGVLPPEASFIRDADVWIPLARDPLDDSQGYSFDGVGRLKPGVTLEEARADLDRAHAPIWAERDTAHVVSPVVMRLRERLAGDSRPVTFALGLAVGLVLLIACANVASILLARSFARRRELGIRVALGASTGRLARQLFAESLTLAVVAAPLGMVLGFGAVRGMVAALPDQLPSWIHFGVDWRTGVFALALVVATAVIFGWAPVAQLRHEDPRDALGEGTGRASAPRRQRRTMNLLVMAEVTLAVVLLVGGGLLYRAYQRLQDVDPGYRTENVLGFGVALPEAAYPDSAARDRLWDGLLTGIEALPGVRAAGLVTCPPLTCHLGNFFHAIGMPEPGPDEQSPVVLTRFATPGYFRVMDIPVLHGRIFRNSDGRVVIINQTFARQFFPGIDNPVGREIAFGSRASPDGDRPFRVIGVTRDVKHYGVDEPMRPGVYFSSRAVPRSGMVPLVWTDVEPTSLVPSIRHVLRELDPELPMYDIFTTHDALAQSLAVRRVYSFGIAGFAAMALLLALGGIYGVLSYLVSQRGHEIGIRMAMGATRRDVLALVIRDGMKLTAAGGFVGLLAALALTAVAGGPLGDMLAGASPRDPVTFAVAAAVLAFTALAATLAPAARALGVEPQAALRDE